jgi:leucyl-tRNA synthetase
LERAGGEVYDAKEGTLVNSDFLNGLDVKAAMKKAISEIESKCIGKGKVNFRLRDAVFGRQRYWGEPIPIYYKNDIPYALPENELPLILPEVDKYLPTEDGEPPLARAKDWFYSPLKGGAQGAGDVNQKYSYELSTMPGWAGSSWYFLRYMDPHNGSAFADKKLTDYWKQVDLYIGGSEHATGHLLYVRFWTKFLKDLGYIDIDEPAKKLINQGMIQGTSDKVYKVTGGISTTFGSKGENTGLHFSFNNGKSVKIPFEYSEILISTDLIKNIDVIAAKAYATNVSIDLVEKNKLNLEAYFNWLPDNKKCILIFNDYYFFNNEYYNYKGEKVSKPENEGFMTFNEVEKMSKSKYNVVTPDDIAEKFGSDTLRLYEMFLGPLEQSKPWNTNGITGVHGFLKKLWRLFYMSGGNIDASTPLSVTNDEPTKAELKTLHKTIKKITEDIERFSFNTSISNFMICVNELTDLKCNKKSVLEPLLLCLSPYAPHITEELWKQLGHTESIAFALFPDFNEAYLIDDNINYPVSVNGKLKFTLELPATFTIQEVEAEVMKNEQTQKLLEGKQPKKVIVVHKKIVNMVV